MAYIYYSSRFRSESNKLSSSSYQIDTSEWRLLKNSRYKLGSSNVHGVLLINSINAFFIPNLDLEDVLAFSMMPDDKKVEQFFVDWFTQNVVVCKRCWGAGKLDWIEQTSPRTYNYQYTRQKRATFKRDPSTIIVSHKYKQIIFSQTTLNVGDIHCEKCLGTGVHMDARSDPLKGLSRLNYTLYSKRLNK